MKLEKKKEYMNSLFFRFQPDAPVGATGSERRRYGLKRTALCVGNEFAAHCVFPGEERRHGVATSGQISQCGGKPILSKVFATNKAHSAIIIRRERIF